MCCMQETDVWYNVPLCPATMSAGQATSSLFVTYPLGASGTTACQNASSATPVLIPVSKSTFHADLKYIAFTMRTSGSTRTPTTAPSRR